MYASKCYSKVRNPYLRNIITLFFIAVVLFSSSRVVARSKENKTTESTKENQTKEWTFHDFLKKFEPKTARRNIRSGRRSVQSNEEYIKAMFDGIDATDALLELDLERIQTVPIRNDTRRYFNPDKNLMLISNYPEDPFNYRKRLFELMKQAIYQARTEMPVWQNMRKQYRDHKLYKMGFLMSKTDNAVKIFSQFAFRSYKLCYLAVWPSIDQMHFYEILLLHERALSLWFNVQLLTDLVLRNDISCRNNSRNVSDYLIENWKYFD